VTVEWLPEPDPAGVKLRLQEVDRHAAEEAFKRRLAAGDPVAVTV
jgi:hypothetical protein